MNFTSISIGPESGLHVWLHNTELEKKRLEKIDVINFLDTHYPRNFSPHIRIYKGARQFDMRGGSLEEVKKFVISTIQ